MLDDATNDRLRDVVMGSGEESEGGVVSDRQLRPLFESYCEGRKVLHVHLRVGLIY
jgi:hypothetical protein